MFECCQHQSLVDMYGGMFCSNCGAEYLLVYPVPKTIQTDDLKPHIFYNDKKIYVSF